MNNDFLITVCIGFVTPQAFYCFRWWKAGKGAEALLRHFAYALFVGLVCWGSLFMLSEYLGSHYYLHVLIALAGSAFMLTSDWYGPFIEGKKIELEDQK